MNRITIENLGSQVRPVCTEPACKPVGRNSYPQGQGGEPLQDRSCHRRFVEPCVDTRSRTGTAGPDRNCNTNFFCALGSPGMIPKVSA